MNKVVRWLRFIALLEGCSFVVLLGVAMPLKYWAGMPLAVKLTGWTHGGLFITLCLLLLLVMIVARWSLRRSAMVFAAALVPLGPFLLDSRMRRWEREAGALDH
jgi:integral membrane protein